MRKIVKTLFGIAALVAFASIATPAAACDLGVGTSAANEVQRTVNQMIDTHRTQCTPAADAERCSIICMTDVRVQNLDVWSLVAAAAGGKAARERGLGKFSSVNVMDRELGQARQYRRVPVEKASAIQAAMAADKLDLAGAFRELKAVTTTVNLPAPK